MAKKREAVTEEEIIDVVEETPKKVVADNKAMDKVLSKFMKKFGDAIIIPDSEESIARLNSSVKSWIPVRIPDAEAVVGVPGKGIPGNKILEIYGPESHGKTTFCYFLLGEVQKAGGLAILIDIENSYDATWAAKIGIDNSRLIIVQPELVPIKGNVKQNRPEGMQEIYQKMEDIARYARKILPEGPVLLVWDSIAATPTIEEFEGEYSDKTPAQQARAMSRGLKRLDPLLSELDVCLIMINQIREKVGVMFGSNKTTPGGRASKFYSSIRAEVVKTKTLKKGQNKVGIQCKLVNHKNKLSSPFKECVFNITEQGITIGEEEVSKMIKRSLADGDIEETDAV